MKKGYVYIVVSKTGTLYIGVTGDLELRILQHKRKQIPGFTKEHECDKLLYFELFENIRNAIVREKEIKGWRRDRKIELFRAKNPGWVDLAADWGKPIVPFDESKRRGVLRFAQDDEQIK